MRCNNKFVNLISINLEFLEYLNLENNIYILGDDLVHLLKLKNLSVLNITNISVLYEAHLIPFIERNVKGLPNKKSKYFLHRPYNIESFREY